MRWFKCLDPKSKTFIEARPVIGDAGLWQLVCLIDEAQRQDVWELSAEMISGWIRVKRDRAEKILPFAQKILDETRKITGKPQEISSKSEKISSKSEDFTPSNPRGSIKEEENRETRTEKRESTPLPPTPVLESDYPPVLTFISSTTKDQIGEEDWVFRGALEHLKADPRSRVNITSTNLAEFCGLNPGGKKLVFSWFKNPPAIRMAAAAYAMKQTGVTNEFSYALKAIEAQWEGYKKLVPFANQCIEAEDYVMEV